MVLFQFYYLIDLHYSQTLQMTVYYSYGFYYLIDLHYSQTALQTEKEVLTVLLPYRFTLFSNGNKL